MENVSQKANIIVDILLSTAKESEERTDIIIIDEDLLLKICNVLKERLGHIPVASILIVEHDAMCQFSELSQLIIHVEGGNKIDWNMFQEGEYAEVNLNYPTQDYNKPWILIWASDFLRDSISMGAVSTMAILFTAFIFSNISFKDAHDYYSAVTQLLVLIFALYTILKTIQAQSEKFDLRAFNSGSLINGLVEEKIIGTTASVCLCFCLIGLLICNDSFRLLGTHSLTEIRIKYGILIFVSVIFHQTLLVFLRSITLYYPNKRATNYKVEGRDMWFSKQREKYNSKN